MSGFAALLAVLSLALAVTAFAWWPEHDRLRRLGSATGRWLGRRRKLSTGLAAALIPGGIAIYPYYPWFRRLHLSASVAVSRLAVAIVLLLAYASIRGLWRRKRLDALPLAAAACCVVSLMTLGAAVAVSRTTSDCELLHPLSEPSMSTRSIDPSAMHSAAPGAPLRGAVPPPLVRLPPITPSPAPTPGPEDELIGGCIAQRHPL